ncbi:MAG: hypothetical protein KAI24_21455, partial [Planctomycetes bacterium]|nr:hypothetical protein [Planctomycetota bacterium]
MSGDSHNKDDADFLDEEDFVVEDIAGKNDDLEDLFDEPAEPAVDDPSKKADEEKDEDDLLFTDHTEGLEASEEFQKPTFAEDKDSEWDGELLDLESVGVDPVGVPEASIEDEEAAADPQLEEVKETFAAELDSMLSDEEDFALDSEIDLEVVGDGAEGAEDGDGISEFEQSGPFVLDDGEGLWSDELEDGEQVDEAVEPATAAAADVDAFELPEAAEVAGEEFDDEAEVANPFVNVTHELPPVDAAEAPTLVTEGPYDALDEIVDGPRAAAGDD